jgi:histidinol-phosphate aminotransferase
VSFDLSRVIRPEVRGLAAYEAPPAPAGPLVKLDANESPFALGDAIRGALAAELAKALADVALHRYPDPEVRELRTALAGELGVSPAQVLVTNGSDEAIQLLAVAAGGPDAAVLVPVPTFVMYELAARALGLRVVRVPLAPGFDLDRRAMLAALEREQPRLVFLAWPNNPTGRLFDEAAVEEIVRACAGQACHALVAVDEAYVHYSGRTFLSRLPRYPNLVILRTLSKIGLAGIRVGMLVGSPALAAEVNKVRLPYNVNALSQAAARAVLAHGEMVRENAAAIVSERERVLGVLAGMPGVRAHPSDANFFLLRTERPAGEVAQALLARAIVVRDFSRAPGLEGCLRVTVGTPAENTAFLAALAEILGRGSGA